MSRIFSPKNTRLIAIAALVVFYGSIRAQVKYSNDFLNIGVDARGLAMAGAQVASTNDVTAGYWNPAGLANITNDFQIAAMHAEYFAGIAQYDYGALAVPFKGKDKVLAVSVIRFGVDNIPNTLNLFNPDGSINYNNITSFSVGDYAAIISYAQKVKQIPGLNIGLNVKIIYQQAGSFAYSWGFGLDAGAQYEIKGVHLGFMAKDITSTFNAWSFNFNSQEQQELAATGNEIPTNSLEITVPTFIFGAAYEFNVKNKFFILPELDVAMTTEGEINVPLQTKSVSFDPRFGLEMNYGRIFYVRFGIGNIQRATNDVNGKNIITWQPDIGAGIHYKWIGVEYTFTNIGDQSQALYSNVVSLHLGFNTRKK